MSESDVNSSINNLIGTFATINSGSYQPIANDLVCIDTSNNRIGINTIDPSYSMHIMDSSGLKIERTNGSTHDVEIIFKNLPTVQTPEELARLVDGQLYKESDGNTFNLKIK